MIKGFLETSFIDWRGRVCAVLFMGDCNFRCPYCHNHPLVLESGSFEDFSLPILLTRLESLKKWLGGVCVSGGEPTLNPNLPGLLMELKQKGWAVKVDTNGSKPEMIAQLLEQGLVDSVSMDVKAPLDQEKYDRCAGTAVDLTAIKNSIEVIRESGIDHEFRMTVVPGYHTEKDVEQWISLFDSRSKLTLQNFNPQTTLLPEISKNKGFSPDIFSAFQAMLLKQIHRVAA
ncbi:MAG: anaerobic ribonucleoside-triphosphate reductase activating protein [Proteobacteria bacterium]|nr:anaerobic ribonucleoside-triphosphate reductase activating protein [Pseudomonadota bacterium]